MPRGVSEQLLWRVSIYSNVGSFVTSYGADNTSRKTALYGIPARNDGFVDRSRVLYMAGFNYATYLGRMVSLSTTYRVDVVAKTVVDGSIAHEQWRSFAGLCGQPALLRGRTLGPSGRVLSHHGACTKHGTQCVQSRWRHVGFSVMRDGPTGFRGGERNGEQSHEKLIFLEKDNGTQ